MQTIKKAIPNLITSIRIFGAVALLFLEPFSLAFYIVYAVCGASDSLDGIVARKLHVTSKLGSVLDSISDIAFYSILAILIFPKMFELLSVYNWIVIIVPTVLQMIGYIVCAIKFKKFSSLHTYANKMLSGTIFFFPFSFIGEVFLVYNLYIYIGGVIAFYAGIEIILIHLIAHEYNEKNKSVFFIKRNEQQLQEGVESV